jgi:DAACS family dicarboxylate/amino acid:cation (Na+ or H+) symporter
LDVAPEIVKDTKGRPALPLYAKIVVALILGVIAGLLLPHRWSEDLDIPAKIVLRLLGAIAPPLILLAVMRALIGAHVSGNLAGKLCFTLALNTLVAILIGLGVANVIDPGRHASLPPGDAPNIAGNPLAHLLDNIPTSLVEPIVDNNVIGVIIIAVAFGLAARKLKPVPKQQLLSALEIGFDLILMVLHWVIALVPLAVFCKVGFVVGTQGFQPFYALGWFIAAVLIALTLQAVYYLARIRFATWVRPAFLLKNTRDALAMAFSTASSTVTMPVTYACLREKVGLREESASLGALVGSNFNNDGTALYEAMAALFIAQMIGANLSLTSEAIVVLTSIVASVGAAGIPEAGLVTMTLVFGAVHLPTGYIALLLPVDWFLDRCRTTINVMGDMNVSCILDGKEREIEEPDPFLKEITG